MLRDGPPGKEQGPGGDSEALNDLLGGESLQSIPTQPAEMAPSGLCAPHLLVELAGPWGVLAGARDGAKPTDHPSVQAVLAARRARLVPEARHLHVVRWISKTRRGDIAQRHFRRRGDALAYAARLEAAGTQAAVFATSTTWREVTP